MNREQRPDRAERMRLETVGHVSFDLPVAGLGNRALAWLLDHLLKIVLFLGLLSFFSLIDRLAFIDALFEERMSVLQWVMTIAFALLSTAIILGYHILFEWLWEGQTPGKRAMKLRVVRDDGGPIGLVEAFVRSALRLVDVFPYFPPYVVGSGAILFTESSKRLGDRVAGTLVVKEEETALLDELEAGIIEEDEPFAPEAQRPELGVALTAREYDLFCEFQERRDHLDLEHRERLARRLAEYIAPRVPLERLGYPPGAANSERLIDDVLASSRQAG